VSTFKPKLSILPAAQKRLWPELRAAADLGLVLYGGTSVVLRLGHRRSVDFDFFSDSDLDRTALTHAFAFIKSATVLQDEPNTLTLSVPMKTGPVKVSFFGGIKFGRYRDPEFTDDGVLLVASLDDLMGTKVKTILQRVESKDYKDIAAMVEAGVDLSRGLAIARAMFGNAFQPAVALKTLTYFEGGDLQTLTAADKQLLVSAAANVGDLPEVHRISDNLAVPRPSTTPQQAVPGDNKAKAKRGRGLAPRTRS